MAASLLLKHRNQQMGLLQTIVSVILYTGHASKKVSHQMLVGKFSRGGFGHKPYSRSHECTEYVLSVAGQLLLRYIYFWIYKQVDLNCDQFSHFR